MSTRKIFITIGIILVIAGMFAYTRYEQAVPQTVSAPAYATATPPALPARTAPAETAVPATTTDASSVATLKIADTAYTVPVHPDETVIEAMRALSSTQQAFTFTGRDYPELGFFVDSINGVKNAGGKYWMLYVNGVSATSGASSEMIRTGDIVEWKYEKSY